MFHCTVKVNIAYEPNKKKLVRYFKQIMALTTIDWQPEFNAQKQWWKKWTNFVKFSLVSISPESVHIHKDTLVIATIMIILFFKKVAEWCETQWPLSDDYCYSSSQPLLWKFSIPRKWSVYRGAVLPSPLEEYNGSKPSVYFR